MAVAYIQNNSSFSESSFIEDFDRTSESSSVFQSSPVLQQAGSPGTDQNLSNAVNQQIKFHQPPAENGTSSASQENDDNRKRACSQWLRYFNEMIVFTRKIESQDVYNLVKPRYRFSDPVKKALKLNLQLTRRDLHEYLMSHLVNNDELFHSLKILRENADLEEAKAILIRADIALRSANKHLLAVSIEAGINFERAFEIHQAEKKHTCSLLGTLKGNYPSWKELSVQASSNK